MEQLQIWRHRAPLTRLKQALQRKEVTVGFIGTSITDARPGHNWPEPVMAWLVDRYPGVRFTVENAAIGATASDLAVFRADRDIVSRQCDVVFVEYAVNDPGMPKDRRCRAREGLLRKLLTPGSMDVVLTYTYHQDMYNDMMNDRMPFSIEEFEELADYYNLPSIWMGLYALDEVKRGLLRWEEWVPDGLHPTHRGSFSYGQSVVRFLEDALADPATDLPVAQSHLPAPLFAKHWGNARLLSFRDVELEGPWTIRRSTQSTWVDQFLETSAVGAKMRFRFTGNALVFVFDFGKASSEFTYRIDGGEPVTVERERPDWCGDSGWLRNATLADELKSGDHQVEIVVTHGNRPDCRGTHFTLGMIGVVEFDPA